MPLPQDLSINLDWSTPTVVDPRRSFVGKRRRHSSKHYTVSKHLLKVGGLGRWFSRSFLIYFENLYTYKYGIVSFPPRSLPTPLMSQHYTSNSLLLLSLLFLHICEYMYVYKHTHITYRMHVLLLTYMSV